MKRLIPINLTTSSVIAEKRRAAGLTQNDIALELGVSEGMISRWETARSPVSASTRAAIEEAIARLAPQRLEVAS